MLGCSSRQTAVEHGSAPPGQQLPSESRTQEPPMPTIVARATLCAALLATPLLVLAQSAILPQQRDAAGNVMEPLGQVLEQGGQGEARMQYCTLDRAWCVRVQPVAEDGDRPTTLEVSEREAGESEPHVYHVSIDVP